MIFASCASLVTFNARYTDVTEPDVVYAAPSNGTTAAPETTVESDESSIANSDEFYEDDHYYSRRLMTSYDPTWDVSFRIWGPSWYLGYYPYSYRYYYYNDYYYWHPYRT